MRDILGELIGFGMSGDAYHITAPSGEGAELAMRNALHDAQLQPTEVQYVNAHGTSTPVGDLAEAKAIRNVFGEHATERAGLRSARPNRSPGTCSARPAASRRSSRFWRCAMA